MRDRKWTVVLLLSVCLGVLFLSGCGKSEVPVPETIAEHQKQLQTWKNDYQIYLKQTADAAAEADKKRHEERISEKNTYNADFYYDNTKSMMGFVNYADAASGIYVQLIREAGNILKSAEYITASGITAYRLKENGAFLEWTECSFSSELMAGFTSLTGNMYTASDEKGSLRRRSDGSPIGPLSMLYAEDEIFDTSAVTVVVTDILEQGFEYDSMLTKINDCMDTVDDFGVAVLGAYSDFFGDFSFTSYANQGLAEVTVRDFDGERAFFIIIMGPAEGVRQYYADMSVQFDSLCETWGGFYCDNTEKIPQLPQAITPVPIPLGNFKQLKAFYDNASAGQQRELQSIGQVLGSLNVSGEEYSSEEQTYENIFCLSKRNQLSLGKDQFTLVSSLMDRTLDPKKQGIVYHPYFELVSDTETDTLSAYIEKPVMSSGMTSYEILEDDVKLQRYDKENDVWKNEDEPIQAGILTAGLYQLSGPLTELDQILLNDHESAAYLRLELENTLEKGDYYLSVPVKAQICLPDEPIKAEMMPPKVKLNIKETELCNMGTTAGAFADAMAKLTYLEHESKGRSIYYSWPGTSPETQETVREIMGKAVDLQYIVKGVMRHSEKLKVPEDIEENFSEPYKNECVQYIDFIIKIE